MTSALFRLGTATTNSAGTSWTWGSYDTSVSAAVGDYVKCELQSTVGVDSLAFSIVTADELSMAALPTVTYTAATRTATFRTSTSAGVAHTYIVKSLVNNGVDRNGDADAALEKRLAVHVKTADGYRLFAVDETDESSRAYGYTGKLNDLVRAAEGGAAFETSRIYSISQGVGTDQYGIPTAIGATYIDSSEWTVPPTEAIFRCVLESTGTAAAQAAYIDLYDVSGVLNSSVPAAVTGSELDNSAAADMTVPVKVQVDLASELAALSGAGVFEARLWIHTTDGTNSVACKSAEIIMSFDYVGGS